VRVVRAAASGWWRRSHGCPLATSRSARRFSVALYSTARICTWTRVLPPPASIRARQTRTSRRSWQILRRPAGVHVPDRLAGSDPVRSSTYTCNVTERRKMTMTTGHQLAYIDPCIRHREREVRTRSESNCMPCLTLLPLVPTELAPRPTIHNLSLRALAITYVFS
jgi:hypothetical protein